MLQLAREGHDVALSYRADADAAARTVASPRAIGARCIALRADVALEAEVEGLFAGVVEQLGRLTGLVDNAGVTAHFGDLADTPVEVIRQVIDVEFSRHGTVCPTSGPAHVGAGRGGRGGAIVNVSSGAATLGAPHEYVHYAGAKAAVEAVTVGLSKELAEDSIRVNAVAPGLVDTDIHTGAGDADRPARIVSRVPLGRVGQPGEIAAAIAWLLSPSRELRDGCRVAGGRWPLTHAQVRVRSVATPLRERSSVAAFRPVMDPSSGPETRQSRRPRRADGSVLLLAGAWPKTRRPPGVFSFGPTLDGARDGIRTHDLRITSALLYH